MENLKQISVKIDPKTLDKIDKFVLRSYGYKRNTIINNILTAIFFEADSNTINNLLQYWRHGSTKLSITIKVKNNSF